MKIFRIHLKYNIGYLLKNNPKNFFIILFSIFVAIGIGSGIYAYRNNHNSLVYLKHKIAVPSTNNTLCTTGEANCTVVKNSQIKSTSSPTKYPTSEPQSSAQSTEPPSYVNAYSKANSFNPNAALLQANINACSNELAGLQNDSSQDESYYLFDIKSIQSMISSDYQNAEQDTIASTVDFEDLLTSVNNQINTYNSDNQNFYSGLLQNYNTDKNINGYDCGWTWTLWQPPTFEQVTINNYQYWPN